MGTTWTAVAWEILRATESHQRFQQQNHVPWHLEVKLNLKFRSRNGRRRFQPAGVNHVNHKMIPELLSNKQIK